MTETIPYSFLISLKVFVWGRVEMGKEFNEMILPLFQARITQVDNSHIDAAYFLDSLVLGNNGHSMQN